MIDSLGTTLCCCLMKGIQRPLVTLLELNYSASKTSPYDGKSSSQRKHCNAERPCFRRGCRASAEEAWRHNCCRRNWFDRVFILDRCRYSASSVSGGRCWRRYVVPRVHGAFAGGGVHTLLGFVGGRSAWNVPVRLAFNGDAGASIDDYGRRVAYWRFAAGALAGTSSLMALFIYWEQLEGKIRPVSVVIGGDVLSLVAIFAATAMLGAAMVSTLRTQYAKANALAANLQEVNATLEQRVEERSAQLADMQQKALNSERLTSLGSMVAGISHELNTPLGNALTVSTTLESQVQTLSQRVEEGKLTRSDMSDFLSGAAEMSLLVTQSITRAANLVASFKQVAVDQTSEQRRVFLLDRVVSDNVAALMPSLGRIHVQVVQDIPADIRCDSFPGPLGQVVTNLVQNAAVHGFNDKAVGQIQIIATLQGDQVELVVVDDGMGMDKKVLMHVFDPFFTTQLGKGGSGLGLSVSYRIATSVLGGSISARSEPGQGSTFTLKFPVKAPAAII
jgi:signal transduction histidine kinase